MVQDLLPTERPTTGDLKVIEEVEYEIIIEWFDDDLSINLYIAPHSEYPELVADDPHQCDFCDGSEEPSTVSDLPPKFQRQFNDVVRLVEDEYNLAEDGEGVCTMCVPSHGGMLNFTTFLH